MPALKNFKSDLRAKYSRYVKISSILTLALLIAAFKLSPRKGGSEIVVTKGFPDIDIIKMPKSIQKPKPPPPPGPVLPDYTDDELLKEIEFDETDLDQNALVDLPPPPPDPPVNDENEIIDFLPIEDRPTPIGGMISIHKKIYYSEIAKKAGVEGTVVIQAVVDQQGNITEAIILKSIGGGLDEIALDAVKNTKFHPGKQRGKPVNVRINIPIKFVLR